jgi:GxxExxY protein
MRTNATNIIYPELSYKLTGILFKVHNNLGRFRNEKQYQDAVEQELKLSGLDYKREVELEVSFDGENKRRNICDFIVENKIIIDTKSKRIITKDDYFQMKRYLSSSKLRLGIIVNFRQKYLTPKRIAN